MGNCSYDQRKAYEAKKSELTARVKEQEKQIVQLLDAHRKQKMHERFGGGDFGSFGGIWDRIFGTMVYDDPRKVKYGLDVLDDSLDENVGYQFKIPFDNTIKTDY